MFTDSPGCRTTMSHLSQNPNEKQFHLGFDKSPTDRPMVSHRFLWIDRLQVDRSPPATAEITEEWGVWRFVSAVAVMEPVENIRKEGFIQLSTSYFESPWYCCLFCFVLFCFVLFCFVLFCFVSTKKKVIRHDHTTSWKWVDSKMHRLRTLYAS